MADGSVKIDITADDSDIKKKLGGIEGEAESAADGLDNLGDSAGNVGDGFGAADVAVGTFVANGISMLISKVGEAVGSLVSLADETREYREDMAKLDTAFTTAGHSTETAQKAYDDFYKILGESDRSVEAVNHLAELTNSEAELAQWSTIAAGVTAKFGDSLPIEGLTEAANETAKVGVVTGGLADALNWAAMDTKVFEKALGGNDRALEEFTWALEAGVSAEDAFNEALALMYTEEERSAAITGVLSGLYSDAAAEYNELTANTQAAREATNNMEQAQAALGAAIEPVTTAWTNMKASALQWFADEGLPALQNGFKWIQSNLPAIAVVVAGATAAWLAFGGAQTILNAVQTAGIAIQAALNAVMNANPIGLVIIAITALVAGFMLLWNNCEGFRNFWIGLWNGIKAVLAPVVEWIKQAFQKAWSGIQSAWNAAKPFFSAIWEGIKSVFSVVANVLGSFFSAAWSAIQSVWNAAKPFFSAIWEGIKTVFSVVASVLGAFFGAAWSAIQSVWNAAKPFFALIWDGIKNVFSVVASILGAYFSAAWSAITFVWSAATGYFSNVWGTIKGIFSAVKSVLSGNFSDAWAAIKGVFSGWGSYFSGLITKLVSLFSDIGSKFLKIGKDIVSGIWNGISNSLTWIKNKISKWVGSVVDFCKKILGIHSPSRVFRDEVGAMIAAGIEVGIEENEDKPANAVKGVFSTMKKVLEGEHKDAVTTVKEHNAELLKAETEHEQELKRLKKETADAKAEAEKEKNETLLELASKYAEEHEKITAEMLELEAEEQKEKKVELYKLEEQYHKDVEKAKKDANKKIEELNTKHTQNIKSENEKYAENVKKTHDDINSVVESKMQEFVSLEEKYKEDTKQVFEDLAKSVDELVKNYEDKLASRTESIANSLNIWGKVEREQMSGSILTYNLRTQVSALEDYNKAIAKLEERNLNPELLNVLKGLGVGAVDEIKAISKMTEKELNLYVETWEKKNQLAKEAAIEELEPLKAETEEQIEALTNTALDKYAELRATYTEQGALLMDELKQAMLEAGEGGYTELIGQIDEYAAAGEDLMSGVIAGIIDKSPAVVSAVRNAVQRAIQAAKDAAGIASPSKVMKKDVGANLAEGINVGWADRIGAVKSKMAADMQGITARIKTAVSLENARMTQGVGVHDTGFAEVAHAVGLQTAGINSLANEFRNGSAAQVTVPLVLDGRELGRAIIDLGSAETTRTGTSLVFA